MRYFQLHNSCSLTEKNLWYKLTQKHESGCCLHINPKYVNIWTIKINVIVFGNWFFIQIKIWNKITDSCLDMELFADSNKLNFNDCVIIKFASIRFYKVCYWIKFTKLFMCNTIDFFTIWNHNPNAEQVIANNFTSLQIIVFKFNEISQ